MNFEFRKKRTKLPELGSGGGGLGDSGNARKKTFFSIDVFPQADRKGGGGEGVSPLGPDVSKCENFDSQKRA